MNENKLVIQPDKLKLEGERFAVECYVKKSNIITSSSGDKSAGLQFDKITKVIAVGNGEKVSNSIKVGDTILIDQPHTPPTPYFSEETDTEKKGIIILDYYLLIGVIEK
jgi:co-chaperonin GroES (HSP10)